VNFTFTFTLQNILELKPKLRGDFERGLPVAHSAARLVQFHSQPTVSLTYNGVCLGLSLLITERYARGMAQVPNFFGMMVLDLNSP
jgi:hypothetical protein